MDFASRIDPDLAAQSADMDELGFDPASIDELIAMRSRWSGMFETLLGPKAAGDDVTCEDVLAAGPVGSPDVPIRIYRPQSPTDPLPWLFWIHGGGMVTGSIAGEDRNCELHVRELRCAVVSVEYRLAPEHPYPAPVEDCYAGLNWVADHAADLGLDPQRIAVMGSSAGGGLAAGTVLLARDREGPVVAYQLLISPMLDDRNISSSSREFSKIPGWNRELNIGGWAAYLGGATDGAEVPVYAAPARATDLGGLPASMIQVAELEVLRDEGIHYAQRLMEAGVPTELHVYPGAFHGWDNFVPDAALSRRAVEERMRALRQALGIAPARLADAARP
jgi:acetyl esterase/lipase